MVISRLKNASVVATPGQEERVRLTLIAPDAAPFGAVTAVLFGRDRIEARLEVEETPPALRRVELSRTTASGVQ